ncbi:sulfotransferase domain-containing protein [Sphingomonas sp. SUN019]|uniref:sulfotransferase domain-containing protein n=1 Tax=Sphingomonas sp. SUN019 TaxID=2937788 RepID=UPI0021644306|nr:sulfotransferase domain-containing protein [Sphingomonas sp. SUN019]UVO51686.1 sulfotransferase domain-containing protein [Sphingomonas sp. SUN019]
MTGVRLPSFIVIGAAKAATTWIAHQLRSRPDVFMPGPEPHFFSRDHGKVARYAQWFGGAQADQMVGEKSADYLADPDAAQRMADLLPTVRLVAQLRDPVARAYSDYRMLFRRGQVGNDIAAYLDRARTTMPRFLDDGLYAQHLERWFDHFPREQIKIILHDDISVAPESVAADVADFLGLPRLPLADAQRRVNDGAAAVLPLALRRLPQPLKKLAAPLRGKRAFDQVRGLFARPVVYPALPDDVRRRVEDFYRDDIVRLEQMIDRDLSHWKARQRSVAA